MVFIDPDRKELFIIASPSLLTSERDKKSKHEDFEPVLLARETYDSPRDVLAEVVELKMESRERKLNLFTLSSHACSFATIKNVVLIRFFISSFTVGL
jgi:hypothetical protein